MDLVLLPVRSHDLGAHGLRVLGAEIEDMADLDAARRHALVGRNRVEEGDLRDRAWQRRMFADRHKEERAYVPARVMNMVVIVDRDFRGEIENRLRRVGRYHPSRLIVVAVEPGRRRLAATAMR